MIPGQAIEIRNFDLEITQSSSSSSAVCILCLRLAKTALKVSCSARSCSVNLLTLFKSPSSGVSSSAVRGLETWRAYRDQNRAFACIHQKQPNEMNIYVYILRDYAYPVISGTRPDDQRRSFLRTRSYHKSHFAPRVTLLTPRHQSECRR
jgi:hypothetical protein